jgi:glutamine synthetase type III
MDMDANTIVVLKNIYAKGFSPTAFTAKVTRVFTTYTTSKGITFENIILNVVPADLFKYITDATASNVPSTIKAGESITGGADLTAFAGWSWVSIAGKLK